MSKAKEWLTRFQDVDASKLASLQAELQGQTAHSQEINAPQSHGIQESELREQSEQQQVWIYVSFTSVLVDDSISIHPEPLTFIRILFLDGV